MRKLTGRNGDADGHTLHLGPPPKVNNVQGAICLRLGRWGAREGVGGWGGEGLQRSTSIWKSRFFLSPQQSARANVTACDAPTLDCAALGSTTWPSLLSHRVRGQQRRTGAFPRGRGERPGAPDCPHARTYTNTSCTACSFSHKGPTEA